MRNPSAVAALFPRLRGELIAALLTQPDRWWYLSELAQFLRTTPSSLQRELKALVGGGILESRREGTRAYFKADKASPLFPELRGLVEKTAGVVPVLREVLAPFEPDIASAFVYGSIARGSEHSQSDIDLLVVGDAGLADLAAGIRQAEARLGREVNVIVYAAREFAKKAASKDHFLSGVLKGPKIFLKGDARDLGAIIGKSRLCGVSGDGEGRTP